MSPATAPLGRTNVHKSDQTELSKQRIYRSIGFADHATTVKSSRRIFVNFILLSVFKIKAVDFNELIRLCPAVVSLSLKSVNMQVTCL